MDGPGIPTPGYREIEPGFHWLQECVSMGSEAPAVDGVDTAHWDSFEGDRHQHQSAYVLADERSLLFDTLSPASTGGALDLVDRALDGGNLDYVAISHPEGNHAGNAFALLEAHPEATLLVPERGAGHGPGFGAEHDLFHLSAAPDAGEGIGNRIEYVAPGDELDLGAFRVEFVPAVYADHAFSVWMVERTTDTLFPVDWLGFHHQAADCVTFADEKDRAVTERDVAQFHGNVFPWLQFADPDAVDARVEEVIEAHDPDRIAPAHGSVIRERPTEYMRMFKSAAREISRQGTPERIRERVEATFPREDERDELGTGETGADR